MRASPIQNRAAARALAVFCTLLWGTAFPFIKLGYAEYGIENGGAGPALLFAGLRFALAGMMVLLFCCVKARRFVLPGRKNAVPVLMLGAVQTFGQYLFTYMGLNLTTGANTSIITACAAFITVLAAPLFFKSDRLDLFKLIGCILGFAGVLVINGGGGFSSVTFPGDILIFVSTVFAAGGNLIAKSVSQNRDPVRLTAYQLLFGGVCLAVAGLICGGRLDPANLRGTLILLWLALVSAVAFSIWTALLKHHPAGSISVFNLLVPVFGTLLSGLLLGEAVFRFEVMLSLILISAGIIMVNVNDERGRGK